jgi:CHASE3 domain sensor protein
VTRENFENIPSTYASQYYQQYVPYSQQQQQQQQINASPGSKDDLMEKMNHIIQMLEDQQDEKTGSVTEELILYCFLGVFVIFVVDSFVRAGKYVR